VKEDPADGQENLEVIIRTTEEGSNAGRSYIYRSSYDDAVSWEAEIDRLVARAKARLNEEQLQEAFGHSSFLMTRARVKQFYESNPFQFATAALIIVSFIVDVTEAKILPPYGSFEDSVFFWCNVGITTCFACEFLLNLFAHSDGCCRSRKKSLRPTLKPKP
jgi:hypothetical protein